MGEPERVWFCQRREPVVCGHYISIHDAAGCHGVTVVDVAEQWDEPCRCPGVVLADGSTPSSRGSAKEAE